MAAPRILRALTTALAALGLILLPAAAAPASAADVDDFSYASWDAHYRVGLDDEGRATMTVTEELVARFPDTDQNRGIVRGLATSYEGARLDTRVLSVTDGDGEPVPYETETDDGVLYVLTGDDSYVRGLTTYVIEYEMRDVVLAAESGVDEFYWDLLPLDSTQPIERFDATVTVDDALATALTGSARCYQGFSGDDESCAIEGPVESADGAEFRVGSGERAAGDGVTVAIGFDAGTVVQPPARLPDPVTDVGPMLATAGTVGLGIASWVAVGVFKKRRRTASGIVVAQYDVPDDLPPLLAGALLPRATAVIPAEIVHLAVRGLLRIEEGPTPERPRLRRLSGGRAPDALDGEAMDALFLGTADTGVVDIPDASETFAARMGVLGTLGEKQASARGFTERRRAPVAVVLGWIAIAVAAAALTVAIWGVASGRLSAIPALLVAAFGAFLVLAACLYAFARHTVLTPEGARRHEYLQGVEEFIRVAEEDRLRMLQSYSGAERRPDGSANVVHVYELLLPYAILFGREDEWARVLENAYAIEQRGPGWIGYGPTGGFGPTLSAFALSTSSASTYTAPSTGTSSSFGGSAGGGFSGGGGGGGFSGGR